MKNRIISLMLVLWITFTAVWGEGGITLAAEYSGVTENAVTPAYFLVKESSAGEWLSNYNYIHYITVDGKRMPAYCVESSKPNPQEGGKYDTISESTMKYSAIAMAGIKEIVRNGYPYTKKIAGTSLSDIQAQAATQMALRMWLSYRREQENADYSVSRMYNPEPTSGVVRIKAGTVSGAKEVYDAAISLFRVAKSGIVTEISVASASGELRMPESIGGDYYAEITVNLVNCDYATISLPKDVKIENVSKGTVEKIQDGAVVKVKIPAAYAGKNMEYKVNGYTNKSDTSLRFFGSRTSMESYQRLFIAMTGVYQVITKAVTVTIPTPTPKYVDITITKSDATNAQKLSGAEFAFYVWSELTKDYEESGEYFIRENGESGVYGLVDINGDYVQFLYTDDNLGKVRIIETKAPDGYYNIDEATGEPYCWDECVVVEGEVRSIEIDAYNDPTRVIQSKVSAADHMGLSGAVLAIYDENDQEILRWTTDGTEKEICGILIAGATYRLHEISAPVGYVLAEDIYFTVSNDGTVVEIEMEDDSTKVEIEKISEATGKPLAGAVMQILDRKGKVIEEWTSSLEKHVMVARLIAGETYILHEVSAPDGYLTAEDREFTVSTDGRVDEIVMRDPYTEVWISKTSLVDGTELAGAKLQLKDTVTGKIVKSWTTTGKVTKIKAQLVAGRKYVLTETAAPDGYVLAESVEFTVNTDGTINKVVMKDAPTKVSIDKISELTGQPLVGAVLQILDGDQIVEEWTSDGTAHELIARLIAGKKYVLHEVSAPIGYIVAQDVEFTVRKDGEWNRIVMRDDYTHIIIRKVAAGTQRVLAGATLRLTDPNGIVMAEWCTEEEATELMAMLTAGSTYYLQELQAPDGYVLSDEVVAFTVAEDKTITTVTMINEETSVGIAKLTEGGAFLSGALLAVYDSNGNLVASFTSEETEKILKGLPFGNYRLVELKAPAGYELAEEVPFEVTQNSSGQQVIMIDEQIENEPKTGDSFGGFRTPLVLLGISMVLFMMTRRLRQGK